MEKYYMDSIAELTKELSEDNLKKIYTLAKIMSEKKRQEVGNE